MPAISGDCKDPRSPLDQYLAPSIVPYAELFRLQMPVGSLYTYCPCLFGTLLLCSSADGPLINPAQLVYVNFILLVGAFLVHGLGCTWNDIVDRDIDRGNSRTAKRPLARRALSVRAALTFAIALLVFGCFIILLLLPWRVILFSVPPFLGGLFYPFAKRFLSYPQLILGLVFSAGVTLCLPVFSKPGLQPPPRLWLELALLYAACVCWTIIYDTIYALQDLQDDLRMGILSTAVTHRRHIKAFLALLIGTHVGILALIGLVGNRSSAYYTFTCAGTAAMETIKVGSLRTESARDCRWWFTHGSYLVSVAISSGFLLEYWNRVAQATR